MKKFIWAGIIFLLIGFTVLYREDLADFYIKNFIQIDKNVTLSANERNPYYITRDYQFVKNTDSFTPRNKQDIKNIYYTVLNAGKTDFSFYCPSDYKECLSDVKDISDDQTLLSHINNYVHAYNGFKNIETEYDTLGKIRLKITHTYTDKQISSINNKVEEIEKTIIGNETDNTKKIKLIHDYIIKNSKYDSDRSDEKIAKYSSDTAYGNLIQGFGICGGYTDSMKIFLDRFNIPNCKIASDNHVWNLVNIGDEWLHLDLTWDDPVVTNGKDVLEYNFFLISTKELEELKTNQHTFDKNVYLEAK
ncbi:MAG: hypothetical protein RSA91_05640 [Bacilli bacterium]